MVKKAKKLKQRKLEERIAPGMIGGGILDPDLAETVESSLDEHPPESPEDNILEFPEQVEPSLEAPPFECAHYDPEIGHYLDFPNAGVQLDIVEGFRPEELAQDQGAQVVFDSLSSSLYMNHEAFESQMAQQLEIEGLDGDTENVQIKPNGSLEMPLPPGTEVNFQRGTVFLPNEGIEIENPPPGHHYEPMEDGRISLDAEEAATDFELGQTGTIAFGPEVTNALTPENLLVQTFENQAIIQFELPEGTAANQDGQLIIPNPDALPVEK